MRLFATAFAAIVLCFSSFTAGTTLAQEVPVRGDNGWVLPVQDTSDTSMRSVQNASDKAVETLNNASQNGPAGSSASATIGSYEAAIYDACARYGCDPNQLIRVMYCESGGNPNAVGRNGELGIFQVDPAYWGYMDSWQQIEFAAYMFATGQGYHWVCQ